MKKKLKDLADIQSGYQFREKIEPCENGNVFVIQMKDVDDKLNIHFSNLVPVKLEKPKVYEVSQGDVLFLARGHRQYAIAIEEAIQNTIATGFFLILHPFEKMVMPSFLAWSINQPEFQEALRPLLRGSHMSLISRADFSELRIELPPLVIQRRVMELQKLFDQELELTMRLLHSREKLFKAVSQLIVNGQNTAKENSHE